MSVSFIENNNNPPQQQQNHSLLNIEHYKSEFSCSSTEIFSKYIGVLSEYFVNCSETINIQNKTYYKYVIVKGMETVSHVFKILLLYTKNLNLTYYHCQKSFYYYVEFISQIGDNNHSFLQLNSRDASLFVYKKTIYEINQEVRKTFTSTVQDNIIMNNVEILIYMYNRILFEKLEHIELSNKDKIIIQDDENKKIKKCDVRLLSIDKDAIRFSQLVLNVSLGGDEKYFYEMLQLIRIFFDSSICATNIKNNNTENENDKDIQQYDKLIENRYAYMDAFIKKIKKNTVSTDYLEKRLLNEENHSKFENLTPLRYMNWLMYGGECV